MLVINRFKGILVYQEVAGLKQGVIEFCSKRGSYQLIPTLFLKRLSEIRFITIFILLLAIFGFNHRDYSQRK